MSDDLIRRQAALKALEFTWAGKAAFDAIKELPSAESQRKKGKWIDETFEFEPWLVVHHPYKCNQCGERSEEDSNFCPNCGAEMKGGDYG